MNDARRTPTDDTAASVETLRPLGSIESHSPDMLCRWSQGGLPDEMLKLPNQLRGCPDHPGAVCVAGSAPCSTQPDCPLAIRPAPRPGT
ncbi:hypothetical protein [Solimonas terrae]|uniref:Uncharacterized protein n=1 Tax=Solimonas terrae TaxID=1396819 RepID=A0A6M2BJS6_9GAMM|nr:hypothetical protein [Solimonas terrae]NGY03202.1 hypothetical protein [Solimonas terrae]